jgi:Protein of unknown function with HXXEE motif
MVFLGLPKSIDLVTLLWIVPIVNFLHEMEEWNVFSWEQATFVGLKPVSHLAIRLFLFAESLFVFFLIWLATRFQDSRVAACIVLPVLALIVLNGAQHIFWSFSFRSYSPGLVFGGIVGVPFYIYLIVGMTWEKLVPLAYTGAVSIIVVFGLVQTVMLGRTMSPLISRLQGFAQKLERLISS